jgi:hypothetical protein
MYELLLSLICASLIVFTFLIGVISTEKARALIGEILFVMGISFLSGGVISFNIENPNYWVFLIAGACLLFLGSVLKLLVKNKIN